MGKYALIGEKLSHSLSPRIHKLILDAVGIGGSYELVEIERDNFREGIGSLLEAGIDGFNVTIPYKQTIIPFLDEISDEAKEIGAVNTVKVESGIMKGYNTDLHGFDAMLGARSIEAESGTRALVIGTGGAAKMVAYWLGQRTQKVWFLSRNARKAMEELRTFQVVERKNESIVRKMDMVVNCSPCGMFPDIGDVPLDTLLLEQVETAVDLIYNPLRTRFIQEMEKKGARVAGGLDMLVAQACRAQEIWNKVRICGEMEKDLMKSFHLKQANPVLIGMPGSGKSSAGRALADLTGREFVDTDALIEDRHGPIDEIFKTRGEAGFREIESGIVKSLRNRRNIVISTGGGAILDPSNVRDLKANGILVYLDRSIESIEASLDGGGRPLLKERDDLKRLYMERKNIYSDAADLTVGDAGNAALQAREIQEAVVKKNF